jgi:hypothetical protein
MTTPSVLPGAAASPEKRPRNSVPLAPEATREARRLAAVILEVLAGVRQPPQAAEALQLSLPRYYQVELRALRGLLAACEPRPRGRHPDVARELTVLRQQHARLERELARQQALLRLAQRAVGVIPAAPAPKTSRKKGRRRQARALTVAARLRQEAAAADPPCDTGVAPGSP